MDRYFRPFREDFSPKGHLLMNTTLNIGLAGLGTVGGGLVRLLSENAEEIRARSGCDFNLKRIKLRRM